VGALGAGVGISAVRASKFVVGGATGIATGTIGPLPLSTDLIGAEACCVQALNTPMLAILNAITNLRVVVITFSLVLIKLIAHPK
jgi:hypothetical protein